ncbi:MAG TPA: hypothetical protein VMU58_03600 [Gaiellaceae bacterium]|nr:hypothetical protein [Gaiellaceae bacterium]
MSLPWVAGTVRARLLLRHRIGRDRALAAAASTTFPAALALLGSGGYRDELQSATDLASAERALAATLLLRLRVLAAWLPPEGASVLRALAGWFELLNIQERRAWFAGGPPPRPFDLGSLSTAWNTLAQAQTPAELRASLARSIWGDPRSERPEQMHVFLRLTLAQRVADTAPELARLADGAVGLLVARELFTEGRPLELLADRRLHRLGRRWQAAPTFTELVVRLPAEASWPLAGIDRTEDLWRCELGWWLEAERAGQRLLRDAGDSRQAVIGAALLLAVDARHASTALGLAALGGDPELQEVLAATP